MSDLLHLGLMAAYLLVLFTVAGNVRVKKMRNISSLIQMAVLLLCLDMLIGFFAIERMFDSTASAGWIMKGIYATPVLFVLSIVWMQRAHKKAAEAEAQHSSASTDA